MHVCVTNALAYHCKIIEKICKLYRIESCSLFLYLKTKKVVCFERKICNSSVYFLFSLFIILKLRFCFYILMSKQEVDLLQKCCLNVSLNQVKVRENSWIWVKTKQRNKIKTKWNIFNVNSDQTNSKHGKDVEDKKSYRVW